VTPRRCAVTRRSFPRVWDHSVAGDELFGPLAKALFAERDAARDCGDAQAEEAAEVKYDAACEAALTAEITRCWKL